MMGASRLNITDYPKGQILMVRKEATGTGRTSKITVEERIKQLDFHGTGYKPQYEMRKLTDKDMDDMIKSAAERTGCHLYSRTILPKKNN